MPREDDLQQLLDGFDHQRWSIACREMQIRLVRGDAITAHEVLDRFARFTGYTVATLQSATAAVLPMRVATSLEHAGYANLQSIDRASDHEILRNTNNIGPSYLAEIRQCIDRVKRGEVLEQFEEDNELLDEACFIRRLPTTCNCHNNQVNMSTATQSNSDQVLAALELLSSSPDTAAEVLDARISQLQAEVKRLRTMRKLLGKTTGVKMPKKNSKTQETLEEEIYQYVLTNGPTKPGDIGEALGLTAIAVGQAVAGSTRMGKQGYKVVIE